MNRKLIRTLLAAAMTSILPVAAASATPMDYTFSGTGAGTINGSSFTGAFTFVFDGDTTNIVAFGTEWQLPNIGGTFTEGGTTYTLDPLNFGIIANPDPANPRVGFFNNDISNGLVMNNNSLAGYNLSTPLGPLTAPNPSDPSSFLLPLLGGTTGFLLDGGTDRLILTEDASLTFTAAPPSSVPEPSTIALVTAGIIGIGMIFHRKETLFRETPLANRDV